MQKESELVGLATMTRDTVRLGVKLVVFDTDFHLAPSATDLLIEHLGLRSTGIIAKSIQCLSRVTSRPPPEAPTRPVRKKGVKQTPKPEMSD